jgi:N-acetylneuraminic acid mutarotase
MKVITLSENSKVTIGLAIALLGGVAFVTRTYFMADSNAAAIEDLQKEQTNLARGLAEIGADTRFMKQLMMEDREKKNGSYRNR